MNSLDELFGEALDRAAMPATQERRHAVAEVAVRGARRRRRVVAAVQGVGVLAVVAVGAVVGAQVLREGPVPQATPTPVPTQPTPQVTPSPNLDYASVLDDRLPQAPAMTQGDWTQVNAEWDVELASMIGGGRDTYGSKVLAYLTPPGGTRLLAYATADTDMTSPFLIGFDPASRTALVFDGQSPAFRSINFTTGVVSPVDLGYNVGWAAAVGRAASGESVFMITTPDGDGNQVGHVLRWDGTTVTEVTRGFTALYSLWGNSFITTVDGVLYVNAVDGSGSREFPVLGDCTAALWTTEGTIYAECAATKEHPTGVVVWNPREGGATDAAEMPLTGAIDGLRSQDGAGGFGVGLYGVMQPPKVFADGKQIADLADGFGDTPKSYSVIFGVRTAP